MSNPCCDLPIADQAEIVPDAEKTPETKRDTSEAACALLQRLGFTRSGSVRYEDGNLPFTRINFNHDSCRCRADICDFYDYRPIVEVVSDETIEVVVRTHLDNDPSRTQLFESTAAHFILAAGPKAPPQ